MIAETTIVNKSRYWINIERGADTSEEVVFGPGPMCPVEIYRATFANKDIGDADWNEYARVTLASIAERHAKGKL